jgi:hypothetical protein
VYLLVTDDKVAAAKYTSRLVFKNASEWMEVCKSGKIRIAISQGLPETLMRQFPDAVAEYVRSV